jgi:hypothetical protein
VRWIPTLRISLRGYLPLLDCFFLFFLFGFPLFVFMTFCIFIVLLVFVVFSLVFVYYLCFSSCFEFIEFGSYAGSLFFSVLFLFTTSFLCIVCLCLAGFLDFVLVYFCAPLFVLFSFIDVYCFGMSASSSELFTDLVLQFSGWSVLIFQVCLSGLEVGFAARSSIVSFDPAFPSGLSWGSLSASFVVRWIPCYGFLSVALVFTVVLAF